MSDLTCHIITFGCQMNVDDSDRVGRRLASLGYRPTDDPIGADLIIVNTCSVREKAAQKVYSLLGRLVEAKRAKPAALLAVAGCLAQQEGQAMLDRGRSPGPGRGHRGDESAARAVGPGRPGPTDH